MGFMTLLGAGKPPSAGTSYDSDAQAYFDAVVGQSGTVSDTRKGLVNDFVLALKAASGTVTSLWADLDCYWMLAAENAASAKVSIKGSTQLLTVMGSPAFTVDRGYTGASGGAPSDYLKTGYIPDGSGGYKLNSATFGGRIRTTSNNDGHDFGVVDGSNISVLLASKGSTQSGAYINSSGIFSTSGAGEDSHGSFAVTRTGSGTVAIYRNGSSTTTNTTSSTALATREFYIAALNLDGTPYISSQRQHASFFAGAGWNATQVSAFHTAENTLLNAVGAT